MKAEGEEPVTKKRRLSAQPDSPAPEEVNFSEQKEALCVSVSQDEKSESNKKGKRWFFAFFSLFVPVIKNLELVTS